MAALITPPAPRLAYEADGSVVLISRTSGVEKTPLDLTDTDPRAVASLNSTQSVGIAIGSTLWTMPAGATYVAKNWIAVMFPRRTDVKAWFFSSLMNGTSDFNDHTPGVTEQSVTVELQISPDTTNGQDGTWTTVTGKIPTDYRLPYRHGNVNVTPVLTAPYAIGNPSYPGFPLGPQQPLEWLTGFDLMYRDQGPTGPGWASVSGADNVRGVRLYFPHRDNVPGGFGFLSMIFHLYGQPSSVSENRLTLTNAAGTGPAPITRGFIDPSTPYFEIPIRVKNLSATETAWDVRMTASSGVPLSYAKHFNVRYSLDHVDWLSLLRVGDIPPLGLSPEVYLRIQPLAGTVGLQFPRVHAQAGEWS